MKSTHDKTPVRSRLRANSEPLYRRLPKTDAAGRHLGDFMMLLPGLRDLPRARLDQRLASLQALVDTSDEIVFADLNLPLNLLWISVNARSGVITEVSARVRQHFPGALLVGHTALERERRPRAHNLGGRLRRALQLILLPQRPG